MLMDMFIGTRQDRLTQRFGLDYEETFSPAIRFESVRSDIALGVQVKLQLHQMDVSMAFLHGELQEEVYMRQPEGFIQEGTERLVCRGSSCPHAV